MRFFVIFVFLSTVFQTGFSQTKNKKIKFEEVSSQDTILYPGIHYNKHYWKAINLVQVNENRNALKEFELAITENRTEAYIYANKGVCELELADTTAGMSDINLALTLEPGNLAASFAKQKLAYEANDLKGAIVIITSLINIHPKMISLYSQRGEWEYDIGKLENAILDYEYILNHDPINQNALFNLAKIKHGYKKYFVSLKYITRYIHLNPNDANGYNGRALTRIMVKDKKGAILDYNRGISLNDTTSLTISMLHNRAVAKIELKMYQSAMKDLNMAIKRSGLPEAGIYSARGSLKLILGDYRGALKDLDFAIENNEKNGNSFFNRGITEHFLHMKDESCRDLSKAGELGYYQSYAAIRHFCN